MATQAVRRRVTVEGTSTGLDKVAQELRGVGAAGERASEGLSGVAKTSDTVEKRSLSVANAYGAVKRRIDDSARASQQMAKDLRVLDQALAQAHISVGQYNADVAQLKERYDASTIAARQAARAASDAAAEAQRQAAQAASADAQAIASLRAQIDPLGAAQAKLNAELAEYAGLAARGKISAQELTAAQALAEKQFEQTAAAIRRQNGIVGANDNMARGRRQNLMFQGFDIGTTLAGGMNPVLIAAQQGPQIIQNYAGNGGVNALLKDAAGLAAGFAKSLGPIAIVAAVGAAGIFGLQQAIQDATGEAVSFGDTFKAVLQVVGGYVYEQLEPAISAIGPYFADAWSMVKEYTADAFNFIVATALSQLEFVKAGAASIYEAFSATYQSIQAVWSNLPAILGDVAIQAAQAVVDGTEQMVNGAIAILNKLIDAANLVGAGIERIGDVDFGEVMNPWAGATQETADEVLSIWSTSIGRIKKMFGEAVIAGQGFFGRDFAGGFFDDVAQQSVKNMEERLRDLKKEARDAKDAARELKQQFDAFEGRADNLLEQYFPGEAARREAHELIDLLEQFGGQLDEFQRKAVETRIDEQFIAAALGIRDLGNETDKTGDKFDKLKDKARDFAEEFRTTVGGAIHDVFTNGIKSIEDFANAFAGMAGDNFQSLTDYIMGAGQFAPAAKPATRVNSQIVGRDIGTAAGKVIADTFYAAEVGPGRGLNPGGPPIDVNLAAKSATSVARAGNAFLDLIGKYEGTDRGRGYNETLGYGAFTGGNRNLIGMTLDQIDALQTSMLRHTANTFNSSALGRYQIVQTTLRELKNQFNLSGDTLFTPKLQDELALQLARVRGAGDPQRLTKTWVGLEKASTDEIARSFKEGVVGQAGSITDAVTKASLTGTEKGATAGVKKGVVEVGSAAATGNSKGGFGQAAFGLLGAGLGGFSTGYQSGSPIMGGLGGALQGWGAGASIASTLGMTSLAMPIIGAAVGGIAGILGAIFAAKDKLKKAQKELEKQMKAIDALLAVGEGRGIGTLQKRLTDYLGEVDKAVSLAWKAQDMKLVERLQQSYNTMWMRLAKDFETGFDGMLNAYRSGRGDEDPYLKGQKAVEQMREEVRNLIADVRFFGESRLKLTPDTPEKAEERAAIMERTAREIEEVTEAARSMALSFLVGAEELTEFEQVMLSIDGAADSLQVVLLELGTASETAAKAIRAQVAAAEAQAKADYIARESGSMFDSADFGYFNELLEVQDRYKSSLRDAAALGLSADLANRNLTLSLRSIAKQAELTDDQIKQLAATMPELSGALMGLLGLNAEGADTGQALADAQAKVEEAKAALRSAYEKERSEIESTISRLKNFTDSIKTFRDSLRLDKELSPLDALERLMEAERQFNQVSAAALGSGPAAEAAQGRLEEVSRAYLEEARSYYGSNEQYAAIWQRVDSTLDQALAKASSQLSNAEKQLKTLEKQVGALIDIDDGVKSVSQAMADLKTAQDAETAAQAADDAYKNNLFVEMLAILKAQLAAQQAADAAAAAAAQAAQQASDAASKSSGYSSADPIANAYRTVLKREPDAEGYAFYAANLAAGRTTIAGIEADLKRYAPGMAEGGWVTGGVPGMDSVLRKLMPREFVMPAAAAQRHAPQLEAMRGGYYGPANDNQAVLLTQLVQQVRSLQESNARLQERIAQILAVGFSQSVASTNRLGDEAAQGKRQQAMQARRKAA